MSLLAMYLSVLTILFLAPFLSKSLHEMTYDDYKINYRFTFMRIFWPISVVICILAATNSVIEELADKRWRA